ncbi:MAG: helix-turn-helix domain-containing protein [Candidatus Eisenbacteria bacterium]
MEGRWIDLIMDTLREAETLRREGLALPEICRRLGVTEPTFRRWVREYGASFPALQDEGREENRKKREEGEEENEDETESATNGRWEK